MCARTLCSSNDGCLASEPKGSVVLLAYETRDARVRVCWENRQHTHEPRVRALRPRATSRAKRVIGQCSWRTRLETHACVCELGKQTTHTHLSRARSTPSCDEPENKRMSDCCYTYEIRWLIYAVIRSSCPLIHNSGRSNTWSVEATKTVAKYEKDCEPQRFCILYHTSNAHCALLPTYDTNA